MVYVARPESLQNIRTLGLPTTLGYQVIGPPSLTRTREQGTPFLTGRIQLVGLLRLRELGDASVNPTLVTIPPALDRA
jgi:hypothetical protein